LTLLILKLEGLELMKEKPAGRWLRSLKKNCIYSIWSPFVGTHTPKL